MPESLSAKLSITDFSSFSPNAANVTEKRTPLPQSLYGTAAISFSFKSHWQKSSDVLNLIPSLMPLGA